MTQRPTYDDANLILKLYEMRREDRMRQARTWFTAKCKVKSYDELIKLADGVPVIIETQPEHRYLVTPQQLEKAITPRTKMIGSA